MRKEPGVYKVEIYDELGHKIKRYKTTNALKAKKEALLDIEGKEGWSAVGSLIVFNTAIRKDKWEYSHGEAKQSRDAKSLQGTIE